MGDLTKLQLATIALLTLALSLGLVLLAWQLLRLWRHHDTRHRPGTRQRPVNLDIWKASARRLEPHSYQQDNHPPSPD